MENAVKYIKENFLRGLELPPWPALNPAGRHWLETIANVRIHRETHQTPLELFTAEKLKLTPVSVLPYDTALVRPLRVNSRFRVVWETNRYSVPAHWAGTSLTAKINADRLALFHQEQPVAEHVRSYERHRDFEHPDHAQPLLAQRQKARREPDVFVLLFDNVYSTNFGQWIEGSWSSRVRLWATEETESHDESLVGNSWEARDGCLAAVSEAGAGELPAMAPGLIVTKETVAAQGGRVAMGALAGRGLLLTAFGLNPYGEGTLLRLWEQDAPRCEISSEGPVISPRKLQGWAPGSTVSLASVASRVVWNCQSWSESPSLA